MKVLLLLIFTLALSAASGQTLSIQTNTFEFTGLLNDLNPKADQIMVVNEWDNEMRYRIQDGKGWKNVSIESKKNNSHTVTGSTLVLCEIETTLPEDSKTKRENLSVGHVYKIHWNSHKKQWELKMIK